MNDLNLLLKQSFHTYQLYLECASIINNDQIKISLLKWPDIAQSAINCILSLERKVDRTSNRLLGEEAVARKTLTNDLRVAVVMPVSSIYDATKARIRDLTGKDPAIEIKKSNDPIETKNNIIDAINKLFIVLSTLSGVEYPVLYKMEN